MHFFEGREPREASAVALFERFGGATALSHAAPFGPRRKHAPIERVAALEGRAALVERRVREQRAEILERLRHRRDHRRRMQSAKLEGSTFDDDRAQPQLSAPTDRTAPVAHTGMNRRAGAPGQVL